MRAANALDLLQIDNSSMWFAVSQQRKKQMASKYIHKLIASSSTTTYVSPAKVGI